MKPAMRGPALRSYSVCPACCSVHASGAACPTCAGSVDPLDAERAAAGQLAPRPPRLSLGRAHVIGLALGLAAFLSVMLLGAMLS